LCRVADEEVGSGSAGSERELLWICHWRPNLRNTDQVFSHHFSRVDRTDRQRKSRGEAEVAAAYPERVCRGSGPRRSVSACTAAANPARHVDTSEAECSEPMSAASPRLCIWCVCGGMFVDVGGFQAPSLIQSACWDRHPQGPSADRVLERLAHVRGSPLCKDKSKQQDSAWCPVRRLCF
jgi:hypothetical protein